MPIFLRGKIHPSGKDVEVEHILSEIEPVETMPLLMWSVYPSLQVITAGRVQAVRLDVPVGTYSGINIFCCNPSFGSPIDDEVFMGIYSEDGTVLLAQTPDFHEDAEFRHTEESDPLSVDFIEPLVLEEDKTVWIGLLSKNSGVSFPNINAYNWLKAKTIEDTIQNDLTALPEILNVSRSTSFVDISGASEGQFLLQPYSSEEATELLDWNVSATDMKTALEALVGEGNVIVTLDGQVYRIEFVDPWDYINSYSQETLDVDPIVLNSSFGQYYPVLALNRA